MFGCGVLKHGVQKSEKFCIGALPINTIFVPGLGEFIFISSQIHCSVYSYSNTFSYS